MTRQCNQEVRGQVDRLRGSAGFDHWCCPVSRARRLLLARLCFGPERDGRDGGVRGLFLKFSVGAQFVNRARDREAFAAVATEFPKTWSQLNLEFARHDFIE